MVPLLPLAVPSTLRPGRIDGRPNCRRHSCSALLPATVAASAPKHSAARPYCAATARASASHVDRCCCAGGAISLNTLAERSSRCRRRRQPSTAAIGCCWCCRSSSSSCWKYRCRELGLIAWRLTSRMGALYGQPLGSRLGIVVL
jgi:hypothetical protein